MKKQLPVYRLQAGTLTRFYFTEYHAEQMARALSLHGMSVSIDTLKLPNDALTRLTVQGAQL